MVRDDLQSSHSPKQLPRGWALLFQLATAALCVPLAGASALPQVVHAGTPTPARLPSSVSRPSFVPLPSFVPPPSIVPSPSPVRPEPVELLHDDVTPAPTAVQSAPKAKVIYFEVTAYCACSRCCGPNAKGVTASGKDVSYNNGAFVAADTDVLSFGTHVSIPGYNDEKPVEVIDRGSAIKGNHLDVFFSSHDQAMQWGRRRLAVTVAQ